FNDASVKLTDDYFITVEPDNKPVVKIVRPGRDWRASNIEEVTMRVEASDDFGIDKLELRYSVNGGEWQTLPLPVDGNYVLGEETLFLEELRQPVRAARAARPSLRSNSTPSIDELLDQVRRGRDGAAETAPAPGEAAPAAPTERGLEPGDVISYYAVAEDRG